MSRHPAYVSDLFGISVVVTPALPPGQAVFMGPADTELDTPPEWRFMDNSERLRWVASHYPELMLLVGEGSTEDQFQLQGGFLA